MASKKAPRKRRGCTEYWIFDRGVLLQANGRPVILKNRKTAERFIEEMGIQDWQVQEGLAQIRETRGRKAHDRPGVNSALLAWAMIKPKNRPTRFEDQRKFVERFTNPVTGNPKQKRMAVRAFIKAIQRLHSKAQVSHSIDSLLST